jgi:hypothetical protein
MYCSEIAQWIPVQLLWIQGLSENYYKIHFSTLFRQFMVPSFTQAECKTLARQVVDFSLAQKEGFVLAYMEVFGKCDYNRALKQLKGCHEHFRAQVTRFKRNRNVIMAHEEVCIRLIHFMMVCKG